MIETSIEYDAPSFRSIIPPDTLGRHARRRGIPHGIVGARAHTKEAPFARARDVRQRTDPSRRQLNDFFA